MKKTIITLSASNSLNSINQQLLNFTLPLLTDFAVTSISVRDYPLPMYGLDEENENGFPKAAKELRELFAKADGFIIASPEHNGSIPAVFKNTVDWLSRMTTSEQPTFFKKPVLLLSTSPGANGGATNIASLTQLMPWWGASAVSSYSLGSFYDKVQDGQLDSIENQALAAAVTSFIHAV